MINGINLDILGIMIKLYRLWVILMIASGLVALSFLGIALAGVWKFINLNETAPAQIVQFQVKELSSSRFAIEAAYSYQVESATYKGKTVFENPLFLTRFAAENYQLFLENKPRIAWYMKRNPTLSSLENNFPYKACLQALVTIGVFLYFYFARGLFLKFISHLSTDKEF